MPPRDQVNVRNAVKPGDLDSIIRLHGQVYEEEYDLDETFEAYVAGPLSQVVMVNDPNQRIWIVEHQGKVLGSIAIVKNSKEEAQLRWFILHPCLRGRGMGKKLVSDAIDFCRDRGYSKVILWTFSELVAAASIYRTHHFIKTEEKTHALWGRDSITEEKYELIL